MVKKIEDSFEKKGKIATWLMIIALIGGYDLFQDSPDDNNSNY